MLRKTACAITLLTLAVVFLASPLTVAQIVTLDYTDRGGYHEFGGHLPSLQNYAVGDFRYIDGEADRRNFFVFDLSAVTQPIAAAKLALTVPAPGGFNSIYSTENYELHDVVTPLSTLLDGTGGVAAHTDLGSGLVYGSRVMTRFDIGTVVEIPLNASAIAALDAANGPIAIGGSITTLDADESWQTLFSGSSNPQNISQLRLTLVPEPSTLFLFGMAAISLLGYRKAKS
jgi:hypothetical protein